MQLRPAILAGLLLLSSVPATAHHSYADYNRNQRSEFTGTITGMYWPNPHIILNVSGATTDMRIDWIAAQRAGFQGISKDVLSVGAEVLIIGSINRNPGRNIMTLIKETRSPAGNWQWVSDTLASTDR